MSRYRIAWMPGDGIGVDVMNATRIVLDRLELDAEYVPADIGWEFWCREGDPLPQRTLDILHETDCALFGAITSKPKEEAARELAPALQGKGLSYRSPIVRLRQELNLHTNLRPCKAYAGNPLNYRDGIDLTVFRENTEGLYAGVEYHPVPKQVAEVLAATSPQWKRFAKVPLEDVAISTRIMTRAGCRSIVTRAFDYAKEHGRPKVTLVEKPNVLRETGGLMTRVAREVAKSYPGIAFDEANVDAMCMWLIKNPESYSVLVCENMFGDIISDLCGQLVGGLGFASSGNIGDNYAVFEPTHGSAPKYAGMNKVNPIATFLAAKLMLEWLGEQERAARLDGAIAKVIGAGAVRTYDMGGRSTTSEMAEAVAASL